MGRLWLVRHGQASFLQENYDKLSELGERQSSLLGEYWARHEMKFDRAVSGPCVRQKDTAKFVAGAYHQAGLSFPGVTVVDELDEYDGEAVLRHALPDLLKSREEFRRLHQAFENSREASEQRKTFQKLFEAVISLWVEEKIAPDGVESWVAFRERVRSGFSKVLSGGVGGERIAVFTSGGPIALAVQRALELTALNTLRVSWRAANCSYSEFLFSADRFTMSTFNSYPHLDEPAMQSYR